MRAIYSVVRELFACFSFLHAKQRGALLRAAKGLISGGRLSLTGLGRHLPGKTTEKHRIKAADRLLGSSPLQTQLVALYRAFAHWMLQGIHRPVLLVDLTGLTPRTFELRVALAFDGRALPLYSEVFAEGFERYPPIHREFLGRLATVIPSWCKPILVTDAGFHYPWFDAVRALGWDFVARIRNSTMVHVADEWVSNKHLYSQANDQNQDLGEVLVGKNRTRCWHMILSKKPISKHRVRKKSRGKSGQPRADNSYTNSAREPWLLATTLQTSASSVVATYSTRMQVEECFRDSKSHRLGWALTDARSRIPRLAVLLFVGAIATSLVNAVGVAAEKLKFHRHFQANTTTHRRVLSFFFLGRRVLETHTRISSHAIRTALADIRRIAFERAPILASPSS